MKMSSCGGSLKGYPVAQHRPQNVDPAASQGDQSLSVSLTLSSIAIVEGPGVGRATAQAGKGRLVEDPFEDLVAAARPVVVAGAFAGAVGRRDQPSVVGGEPVGALEGAEVARGHQELGRKDRTHAGHG